MFDPQVNAVEGAQHQAWQHLGLEVRIGHELIPLKGQTHRHLHFIHGKGLANAVPEGGAERREFSTATAR